MKKMNRILAGVATAAMLATPVAAADFGYDMGLEADTQTYGGVYYSVPFQGRTAKETRDGSTLGFQVDRKSGQVDPFSGAKGLTGKALFDLSFDETLNLNSFFVNGIETVDLYEQLKANGDNEDTLGGYLPLIAVGVVVGGAALVESQSDDNNDRCVRPKSTDTATFTDALYVEDSAPVRKCPPRDVE
ncbi:MAG: hypothetical protein ACPG06_07795 [Alphaproteobacteria bacterium]